MASGLRIKNKAQCSRLAKSLRQHILLKKPHSVHAQAYSKAAGESIQTIAMLRFEKKLEVTPDNVEDLSEIQRAQLFDVYAKQFGKEPSSIEAMFFDESSSSIALCEFYQVYDSEEESEPKYDVWIVNIDAGAVYESGTLLDAGIEMVQHNFQAKKSSDKALAQELQSAFLHYVRQVQQKREEALESEDGERIFANTLTRELINGRAEKVMPLPTAEEETAAKAKKSGKKAAAKAKSASSKATQKARAGQKTTTKTRPATAKVGKKPTAAKATPAAKHATRKKAKGSSNSERAASQRKGRLQKSKEQRKGRKK